MNEKTIKIAFGIIASVDFFSALIVLKYSLSLSITLLIIGSLTSYPRSLLPN